MRLAALMLVFLAGCPWVGPAGEARLRDLDEDGVESIRYGGRDCDDSDPTVGDCDEDEDGFLTPAFGGTDCDDANGSVNPDAIERCDGIDNDCDGAVDDQDDIPSEAILSWYPDADGDGFGAGAALEICIPPSGYADNDLDCDDSNATVNPVSLELCDPIDHDCDGDPTANAADTELWYADGDADGFGGAFLEQSCDGPGGGAVTNGDDCDDADTLAHPVGSPPDSTEVCDGIDNDCNGLIDDADPGLDPASQTPFFLDGDADGYGDTEVLACAQPTGAVADGGDCDDADPFVSPGAVEACGGVDEDCDGLIDAADPDLVATVWYLDNDGDGIGQPGATLQQCDQPSGYVAISGDCNDFDATISDEVTFFPDVDGDGFGDASGTATSGCVPPLGFVRTSGDCDDTDPGVSPAAAEICDGLDNDCDTLVDDDPIGSALWYLDADVDGFGAGVPSGPGCRPMDGQEWTQTPGDCDDQEPLASPAGLEVCDGIDNDCDTLVDDDDSSVQLERWYRDADGDTYGRNDIFQDACVPPGGFVSDDSDCDDLDPDRWWAVVEVPGESPDIADAASHLCTLGVILLDPALDHPADLDVSLPLTITSQVVGQPARILVPPNRPAFRVPFAGGLFIEGVVFDGESATRTDPVVEMGLLSTLSFSNSTVVDWIQIDSPFVLSAGGAVLTRTLDVSNSRFDRGLADAASGLLQITDSTFTDVSGQTASDGTDGTLFRATSATEVLLDGVDCVRCTGSALFESPWALIVAPQGIVDSSFVDSAPLVVDSTFGVAGSSFQGSPGGFGGTVRTLFGDLVIESSTFTDFGVFSVDARLVMTDVDFIGSGGATAPQIDVTPNGTLDITLATFDRTGGIRNDGVTSLTGVEMRQVGSATVPALHNGPPVLFVASPSLGLTGGLIVEPQGDILLENTTWLQGTRFVRPGARDPWMETTAGDALMSQSVVSQASSGIRLTNGQVHNSAFLDSADAFESAGLFSQVSHNLFVDTASNLTGLTACQYCMYTGTFDVFDPDPLPFDDEQLLTYSLDVDSDLWLPVITAPRDFEDSGAPGWDEDGTAGDRGLTGGIGGSPFQTDLNGNGLWDGWESLHISFSFIDGDVQCFSLAVGADCDGDGLLDEEEQAAGTWPSIADTDGDGLLDGADPFPLTD